MSNLGGYPSRFICSSASVIVRTLTIVLHNGSTIDAVPCCSSELAPLACALDSTENLRELHVVMGLGSSHERGRNCHCFGMASNPGDEGSVARAGQPLEINPGVIGAHIRIHKRSSRIKNYLLLNAGEFLVRRLLGLPVRKSRDDGQRTCPAEGLARGPLHKRSAVDLGS